MRFLFGHIQIIIILNFKFCEHWQPILKVFSHPESSFKVDMRCQTHIYRWFSACFSTHACHFFLKILRTDCMLIYKFVFGSYDCGSYEAAYSGGSCLRISGGDDTLGSVQLYESSISVKDHQLHVSYSVSTHPDANSFRAHTWYILCIFLLSSQYQFYTLCTCLALNINWNVRNMLLGLDLGCVCIFFFYQRFASISTNMIVGPSIGVSSHVHFYELFVSISIRMKRTC